MTYAEPLVVHCPHCDKKLSQTQLGSGNTFGARYWTDSKREAPMLIDIPDLVRCPHCNELLIVSEARESTDEPEDHGLRRWESHYPRGVEPELADWIQAINQRLWNDEDGEKYLRFSAWWASNDAWRPRGDSDANPTTSQANLTADDESNLKALLAMLETTDDPNSVITRAEILRELGDFQNSIQLLKNLTDEKYAFARNLILGLAEKGVREVQEMKFD